MSVKVNNRLPQFAVSAHSVMDDALREASRDILIRAKTRAPFKQGGLRGDSEAHTTGHLKWRVSFWKEYARFQEFGGDSKRRVRQYSTSGTGKKYLKSSGDEQMGKMALVFKKHGVRAR